MSHCREAWNCAGGGRTRLRTPLLREKSRISYTADLEGGGNLSEEVMGDDGKDSRMNADRSGKESSFRRRGLGKHALRETRNDLTQHSRLAETSPGRFRRTSFGWKTRLVVG